MLKSLYKDFKRKLFSRTSYTLDHDSTKAPPVSGISYSPINETSENLKPDSIQYAAIVNIRPRFRDPHDALPAIPNQGAVIYQDLNFDTANVGSNLDYESMQGKSENDYDSIEPTYMPMRSAYPEYTPHTLLTQEQPSYRNNVFTQYENVISMNKQHYQNEKEKFFAHLYRQYLDEEHTEI